MNWELNVINGEGIIHYCSVFVVEKVSNSISVNSLRQPDGQIPMALSIDTYIGYLFMIAIVLGFVYHTRQNVKNKSV